MSAWSALDWTVFLGALGTFATTIGTVIVGVIKSRRDIATLAKGQAEIARNQTASPGPSPHPSVIVDADRIAGTAKPPEDQ